MILPLRDIWKHLETFLVVTTGGSTTGIETRDTIKHPTGQHPQPHKELSGPNAIIVKVEKHTFQCWNG